VLVLLFATPLWYANSTHFRAETHAALSRAAPPPKALVLDAFGMSDVDFTGSREISQLLDELERQKILFAIARAGQHVRDNLEHSGLLARIGANHLFSSADEAVVALRAELDRAGRATGTPGTPRTEPA